MSDPNIDYPPNPGGWYTRKHYWLSRTERLENGWIVDCPHPWYTRLWALVRGR